MSKQKTTVYLDPDVLTAAKAVALTSKRSESAVIEDALRSYLEGGYGESTRAQLSELLTRVASRSDVDEVAAMKLAVGETRAVRRRRRNAKAEVAG